MSVICKMSVQNIAAGKLGRTVHLSPVWEGTTELQSKSENAIFGDATPGGDCVLQGLDVALDAFEHGEDYYIWLFDHADPTERMVNRAPLVRGIVGAVFRQEPARADQTDYGRQFRFIGTHMQLSSITLSLYIRNAACYPFLDATDMLDVLICKAVGRRESDAAIAARQKLLDEHIAAQHRTYNDRPIWSPDGWEKQRAVLAKRLARAKGEDA